MILHVRPLTHVPAIQMEFVHAALGILEIIVLNVKQVILIQMETILILVQLAQVYFFLQQKLDKLHINNGIPSKIRLCLFY